MKGIIMKIFLIFLFVCLFSICASCQTMLPSYLAWDYDYTQNVPEYQDSIIIMFDVFKGLSLSDTSYVLFDSTQMHDLRLLSYEELYNAQGYYFYCRARALTDEAISLPSDTVYGYFPKILAGEPYNIQVLKTKMP